MKRILWVVVVMSMSACGGEDGGNDGPISSPSPSDSTGVNRPPEARYTSVGLDQNGRINGSGEIILDGTASVDPDNDNLVYQWKVIPLNFDYYIAEVSNVSDGKVGIKLNPSYGIYQATLLVSDGVEESSLSIFINGMNNAKTTLSGLLEGNIQLTDSDSPVLIMDNTIIDANATVTVSSNVALVSGGSGQTNLTLNGELNIIGTPDQRVLFSGVDITGGGIFNSENAIIQDSLFGSNTGINISRSVIDTDIRSNPLQPDDSLLIEKSLFYFSGVQAFVANVYDDPSQEPDVRILNNIFIGYSQRQANAPDPDFPAVRCGSGQFKEFLIKYNSFLTVDRIAARCGRITDNYWGTQDPVVIDQMIYAGNDTSSEGSPPDFTPFLNAPHPDTPELSFFGIR